MQLKQIAQITSGYNSQELKKEFGELKTYTNDDLEFDLYQGYHQPIQRDNTKAITQAGDLLMNTMTNRSAIVSPPSAGKVMPQHIMRLGLNSKQVDSWYLCYVLNESESVQRQLYSTMEGTVLRRVTAANIKQLTIALPTLAPQHQIGDLYRTLLVYTRLHREYVHQLRQVILKILNDNDINGGNT